MYKKITLLVILTLVTITIYGQTNFNNHIVDQNSSIAGGYGAVVDLDNDGDNDFVTSETSTNQIVWYENDGNQNFTSHVVMNQLSQVYAIGIADMNSDGHPDIWAQVSGTLEFILLINDGNQVFTQASIPELVDVDYADVLDFDYDGKIDLFISNYTTGTMAWLKNEGNLNFTTQTFSIDLTTDFPLIMVDLDNDSKRDFLIRNTTTNEIGWYKNIDNSSFSKQPYSSNIYDDYVYGIYKDIDGDHLNDLIGFSSSTGELSWLKNDGNQSFVKNIIATVTEFPILSIYVEDIDQDQDQDIVIGNFTSKKVVWFENDGSQNFTERIITENIEGGSLDQFIIADIDNDSDKDFLTAGYNSKAVQWFENYFTSQNIGDHAYQSPNLGNHNYVYTIAPQKAMTTLDSVKINSDAIENVQYFDGLGRPMQTVAIRAGGKGEDLITKITYDAFGRQTKDYLPYAESSNTGEKYRPTIDLNGYYKNKYASDFANTIEAEINPYSEKHFEASPLNRILEQAAPGDSWKLDKTSATDHTIKFEYQTNTLDVSDPDADNVRLFEVTFTGDPVATESPSLIENGHYAANELYKTITKDENWQSGQANEKDHTTEEFKDKQGRVLLKRTYGTSTVNTVPQLGAAHDTYYVYDDYGNLTYVIPPKAADNTTIDQNILDELCYQYKYDYRNRLIEKKIPGKGLESIVYDKLDRPVLTQDTNLNTQGVWLFTKYDAFGRVVYTGKYTDNNDRATLQTTFTNKANALDNYEERGTSSLGIEYSNTDFPNTNLEVLTVNYYDDYGFTGVPFNPTTNPETIFNAQTTDKVKSLATGSKTKVLGTTNDWITTVTYYDNKARPIYVYSTNEYLNTTDIIKTDLDFVGKTLKVRTSHIYGNEPELVTLDTFTYDQAGRILKQVQCIGGSTLEDDCGNNGAEGIQNTLVTTETVNPGVTTAIEAGNAIELNPGFEASPIPGQTVEIQITQGTISGSQIELIADNTYDELGQLVTKKVGNIESNALQNVSYNYNVRGWLKKINEDQVNDNDLFNFTINYNDIADVNRRLYNGNISQTQWNTLSDNAATNGNLVSTAYTYTYDALDRIISAVDNTNNYSLSSINYDKNGNVTSLLRRGHTNLGATNFGVMDDLTYSYQANSNKLLKIADAAPIDQFGFKDDAVNTAADTADDYTYDSNGSMKMNTNRGITNILYNHLNLPTQVTVNGQNINYTYDAAGTRLKKVAGSKTVEYAGNFLYENNTLKHIKHNEGYVEPDGNGYRYVYSYVDNLGNIRLNYSDLDGNGTISTSEILDEKNYYPFGGTHEGYNTAINGVYHPYGFNGKEENDENGIEWLDFGARNYDKWGVRWMTIDMKADANGQIGMSPYAYAHNNPVIFIDPDGNCPPGVDCVKAYLFVRSKAKQLQKWGSDKIKNANRVATGMIRTYDKADKTTGGNGISTGRKAQIYASRYLKEFGGETSLNDVSVVKEGKHLDGSKASGLDKTIAVAAVVLPISGKKLKTLGGEGLDALKKVFNKTSNQAKHLDSKHINAAVGDILGNPITINGKTYDHLDEVQNALDGLGNQLGKLNKQIEAGEFSGEVLDAAQNLRSTLQKQKDQITDILNRAVKKANE